MKRKMITSIVIVAVIAVAACMLMSMPVFGRNPRGARLERVKQSPYYKDGQFQNEEPTMMMTGSSMWTSTVDWVTGRKKSKRCVPKAGEVPVVKSDLKYLKVEIWLAVVYQVHKILTNQIYSLNVS